MNWIFELWLILKSFYYINDSKMDFRILHLLKLDREKYIFYIQGRK